MMITVTANARPVRSPKITRQLGDQPRTWQGEKLSFFDNRVVLDGVTILVVLEHGSLFVPVADGQLGNRGWSELVVG
jgi:hypothetical protein